MERSTDKIKEKDVESKGVAEEDTHERPGLKNCKNRLVSIAKNVEDDIFWIGYSSEAVGIAEEFEPKDPKKVKDTPFVEKEDEGDRLATERNHRKPIRNPFAVFMMDTTFAVQSNLLKCKKQF